jgi:hypothetical protein
MLEALAMKQGATYILVERRYLEYFTLRRAISPRKRRSATHTKLSEFS